MFYYNFKVGLFNSLAVLKDYYFPSYVKELGYRQEIQAKYQGQENIIKGNYN